MGLLSSANLLDGSFIEAILVTERMKGTGVPLVTPFDTDGSIATEKLRDLVERVERSGIDFIVPCGSTSEAALMTFEERVQVIETVSETASVPIIAGTGTPGFEETRLQTKRAGEAGADAALVVTPFYYSHSQHTLSEYYESVADRSDIPIYLYSVPKFTGTKLAPETIGDLAEHDNIHGVKDSSGDLEDFQITRSLAPDIDLLIGSGSIYASGLDVGADGGVLALANLKPQKTSKIYRLHRSGETAKACRTNTDLAQLNRAITGEHGIPGLKYLMRTQGSPAGHCRSPLNEVSEAETDELASLVETYDLRN